MWKTVLAWTGRLLLLGLGGLLVANCTMLGLNYASLEIGNKPAPRPAIAADTLEAWRDQRAALKHAFEAHVYGPWPEGLPVKRISRRVAEPDYLAGRGVLEEWVVRIGHGDGARDFRLGLARPADRETGPHPVIVGQSFVSNCYVFASSSLTDPEGQACTSTDVPWPFEFVFGEYIATVPMAQVFDAGFAYANFHASDIVPDSARRAGAVLAGLVPPDTPDSPGADRQASGALMAWAYGYKAAIDVLAVDPALDARRIAVFGHSRHGKAALIAGAWDPRIAAVVSHQSGFGGAALSRSPVGEGVARITRRYPHWFDPAFAAYAGRTDALPVDQHQLLALNAPRPVFLGNARRDVWSDPNSTFRAARGALPVYRLHAPGCAGLPAMSVFQPADCLAYFLRPGGHGTDQRDMAAILSFLTAHLGAPQTGNGG